MVILLLLLLPIFINNPYLEKALHSQIHYLISFVAFTGYASRWLLPITSVGCIL